MKKVFIDELPHGGRRINKNSINWKASIGYKVKFISNNIEGEIEIINAYLQNNISYIDCKYNNINYHHINCDSFKKCQLGKILGTKTSNYKYKVGDIITDVHSGKLKILEQIRIGKDKQKGYKYHCLICSNEDQIVESSLKNHIGCNVCCSPSQKVLIGYNDMATTNKKLFKLLANKEDNYKYTQSSHKYIDWKCPNCGNIIKNKRISAINKYGLSCPNCSDGIDYPEKTMYCILKQLKVDFIYQLSKKDFEWCSKYSYDFYFKINNEQYIIETHGLQHYKNSFSKIKSNKKIRNLKEEQENDKNKKELALQNGIKEDNYIVIDCRESELKFIKNNILNSRLNDIFDLNKINWLECHEFACKSLVKKACDLCNKETYSTIEIGKIMKLNQSTIIKYLKQGKKLNWCDYDAKKVMKLNALKNGEKLKKQIICLNKNKIFNSIAEAKKYYKINSDIGQCCQGKRNYAGKDTVTGGYLQWQYYDEYLIKPKKLLTNEEIINNYKNNKKQIICLNNKKVFISITDAGKYYNIKYFEKRVNVCCKDIQKSCGKNPITGEKLHWMYYDEYLNLNNKQENKVVNE